MSLFASYSFKMKLLISIISEHYVSGAEKPFSEIS